MLSLECLLWHCVRSRNNRAKIKYYVLAGRNDLTHCGHACGQLRPSLYSCIRQSHFLGGEAYDACTRAHEERDTLRK